MLKFNAHSGDIQRNIQQVVENDSTLTTDRERLKRTQKLARDAEAALDAIEYESNSVRSEHDLNKWVE